MVRSVLCAMGAVIALALAPALAQAALVSEPTGGAPTIQFTGDPGESNQLQVSGGAGEVTFTDAGASIDLDSSSVADCDWGDDAHTVTCTQPSGTGISINLGDGNDTLTSRVVAGVIAGTGNDTITMLAGGSVSGGDGNDVISAIGAAPSISGENGDDTLTVQAPATSPTPAGMVIGGAGNDTITSTGGSTRLQGGAGDDHLVVAPAPGFGPSTTVLDGGDDNDTLDGGPGTDRMTGGAGDDVLRGNGGDDGLDGGDGNDVLSGGDGKDGLSGGNGNDALDGGPGNDTLNGGPGADAISGGPDVDSLSYADHTVGVSVTPDGIANDGSPGEGDNVSADVENLTGTLQSDVLYGSAANNYIVGSEYPKPPYAGGQFPVIAGDTIVGGGGFDTIYSIGSNSRIDVRDAGVGAHPLPTFSFWDDIVDCTGAGSVITADPGVDLIRASGCAVKGGALPRQTLRMTANGGVALPVPCPPLGLCSGTVRLTGALHASPNRQPTGGRLLAPATPFQTAAGTSTPVRLQLSAAARKVVRTRHRLLVSVAVVGQTGPTEPHFTGRWPVALTFPAPKKRPAKHHKASKHRRSHAPRRRRR